MGVHGHHNLHINKYNLHTGNFVVITVSYSVSYPPASCLQFVCVFMYVCDIIFLIFHYVLFLQYRL